MKKILFQIASLLLLGSGVLAQTYEGTIEYDKKKQRAFVIEYAYPVEAVENGFLKRMETLGHKSKSEKGLFNSDKGAKVFKGEYLSEISDKRLDYVAKVEKKSKKEDDHSLLYLIVMKDGVNYMDNLDATEFAAAKAFLNNLYDDVEASDLEIQIKAQEDVVAKSEKKLKKLEDDKKSMEDKIKKLESDIKDNVKAQEDAQKEIDSQRQSLESLKAKRKI